MGPDNHDIRQGLKLAVIAAVSAVATATLVISTGHAVLGDDRAPARGQIIQVSATR